MATATTTSAWANTSDANFRAWGKWVDDRFEAFGWVNVSRVFGTGTNWTDVTAPASANQARVTSIYRMNDSLQSTTPVFVEIFIGSGFAAADPGVRIRVGTGATGSTLTGILFDTGTTYISGNDHADTATHFASGSSSRITVAMSVQTTGTFAAAHVMVFGIERRKDANGADVGTGVLVAAYGFWNGGPHRVATQASAAPFPNIINSAWGIPSMGSATQQVYEERIAVWPQVFVTPGEIGLNFVGAPQNSYSRGGTFSVSLLGASRTYVVFQQDRSSLEGGLSNTCVWAMRYE